MVSHGLFRKEVIEAKREQWLGPMHLAVPMSFYWPTFLAAAFVVATIVFMVFGQYTRALSVSGQLVVRRDSPSGFQAELLVPDDTINLVRTGDRVVIVYPSYPPDQIGPETGRVTDVSRTPIPYATVKPDEFPGALGNQRQYRVLVALDRPFPSLRFGGVGPSAGTLLNAEIFTDHRSLWQWTFNPM